MFWFWYIVHHRVFFVCLCTINFNLFSNMDPTVVLLRSFSCIFSFIFLLYIHKCICDFEDILNKFSIIQNKYQVHNSIYVRCNKELHLTSKTIVCTKDFQNFFLNNNKKKTVELKVEKKICSYKCYRRRRAEKWKQKNNFEMNLCCCYLMDYMAASAIWITWTFFFSKIFHYCILLWLLTTLKHVDFIHQTVYRLL